MTARTPEDIRNELLVIRAQAGEEAALRELVETWHKTLVRDAWFRLKSVDAAAEVVQEAWIAIFRGLRRLKDPSAFPAWAQQITRRRAADWIRAEAKRRNNQQQLGESTSVEQASTSDASQDIQIDRLKQAITRLPQDLKPLVELYYGAQLSIREVANKLSLPEGTVKHRLFRARNELRQQLTQGEENE